MKWQPIETAPKDGSFILVASAHHDMWVAQMSALPNEARPVLEESGKYLDDITHWMPLPPSPNCTFCSGTGDVLLFSGDYLSRCACAAGKQPATH